jgi:hypothetical protein
MKVERLTGIHYYRQGNKRVIVDWDQKTITSHHDDRVGPGLPARGMSESTLWSWEAAARAGKSDVIRDWGGRTLILLGPATPSEAEGIEGEGR